MRMFLKIIMTLSSEFASNSFMLSFSSSFLASTSAEILSSEILNT